MTMRSEFFLFGDCFALDELALSRAFFIFEGRALDELALDGFFLFFEGCALDGATHHACFALEACALCGGVQDACGVVGGHALEGVGFLSVCRSHSFFLFVLNCVY